MARKIFKTLLIYPLLIFSANLAFAQAVENASKKEWEPVSPGPLTTSSASLCGKGKLVVQPYFFYNRTRGAFDPDGHYNSLPDGDEKDQYQEQLFMQLGITDSLEIDGQTVYQENYVKQDGVKARADGFGDSYLFVRYCVLDEKGWVPHLTVIGSLKMPTGKYQKADPDKLGTDLMGATSGGGSWDPGFGFNLSKQLKPFIVHLDAIYSFPQEVRVDGVKTLYGNYLNYDAAIEFFLPEGFNLLCEVNGFLQGDRRQDGEDIYSSDVNYLTLVPGIGWSNETIQILLAYQRVVAGTNTDANDSVAVTCVFTF